MITSLQIRAARSLVGWSQVMLASRAGVSPITVKRLEANVGADAKVSTVVKITDALKEAGVVFLDPRDGLSHGVGLRDTS